MDMKGESIWPNNERGQPGYVGITDDPDNNKLFYWFFPSRNDPSNDPLIVWFSGGPGCSGELALAFENGPFTFNPDTKKLTSNPNSWNNKANVLFMDQPLGTGYSFGDASKFSKNEDDTKEQFYEFFVKWLSMSSFSSLKGRDLYLFGESYGGHYVPQISNRLFTANNPDINLKGIGVGNGWTTPHSHMKTMIDYVDFLGKDSPITPEMVSYMKDRYQLATFWSDGKFVNNLPQKNKDLPLSSNQYVPFMNQESSVSPFDIMWGNLGYLTQQIPQFNLYDVYSKCVGSLCYNLGGLKDLFNSQKVREDLGIDGRSNWEACQGSVGSIIKDQDYFTDSAHNLKEMLNGGVKVLFYTGENDYVCNWKGHEDLLKNLKWWGESGWKAQKYSDWTPKKANRKNSGSSNSGQKEKNYIGQQMKFGNLWFLRIAGAGHLVPHNKPVESLAMVEEFINDF